MEDALNFDDASVGINASIRKVGAGSVGGAFGGTSIGNITINIDGAKYSDEQSLAEAVAQAIQDMTDRRSAVYA
jgi:FlaG/FlaF family flagellin (archaellin)